MCYLHICVLEEDIRCPALSHSTLFSGDKVFLLNLELGWQPAIPSSPASHPSAPHKHSDVCGYTQLFSVGPGDLNSGSDACAASAFIH